MRSLHLVDFVVPLLLLLGCSSHPRAVKTDPYLVSEGEFKSSVRVLAVAPVEIPEGLPDAMPIVDEFTALIDAELARYGYSVVRPQEYESTWNKVSAGMNGFRDRETGGRDEASLSKAMVRALEELGAGFKIDGILFPEIVVVEAAFGAGSAVWDGTAQEVETAGPMESFLAGSQRGVVGALSLRARIRDREGRPVYLNSGGIEVLSKMIGKLFVKVPPQELFTNKERNREAVEIALRPLKR
jgi:hypothetical protein